MQALEVILEEYPAFVGPYSRTAAQCLECFRPSRRGGDLERCARCGLPLCTDGERCASRGRLHQDECQVMQRAGYR